MKRFAVVALVLAGCRTLVGIDDLQFDPGRPTNDGGNGQQNQGDGAAPGLSQQQQDDINNCDFDSGADCRRCCKTAFKALPQTFETGRGAACICATCTQCFNEAGVCDPASFQSTGTTQPTPDSCVVCSDNTLSDKSSNCGASCAPNETDCFAGVKCLQGCQ